MTKIPHEIQEIIKIPPKHKITKIPLKPRKITKISPKTPKMTKIPSKPKNDQNIPET